MDTCEFEQAGSKTERRLWRAWNLYWLEFLPIRMGCRDRALAVTLRQDQRLREVDDNRLRRLSA